MAGSQIGNAPPPQEVGSTWSARPPEQPPIDAVDPAGQALQQRFYSLTTFIVPPIFIAFLALLALADIPHKADRTYGVVAAVLAVLLIVVFVRRPYVAIARRDGSLTFKALIGSKDTTISRSIA